MIIGIAGKKQSGKDTIAKIIKYADIYNSCMEDYVTISKEEFIYNCITDDHYKHLNELVLPNSKWEIHAFADKLKNCISLIAGFTDLWTESGKNTLSQFENTHQLTYRELLQQFGTEVCRNIDKNFWIKALFMNYKKSDNWIIPDVRFINEADSIKKYNGIIIKVIRNSNNLDKHVSELEIDSINNYDYLINNNGSLEELIESICLLYENLDTNK